MGTIYLDNRERKEKLAGELARIVETLKKIDGIEKVILYGSMAGGVIGVKSDLDLIVVQKTNKKFLARSIDLVKQINPTIATDISVYTPEEFAEMQKSPGRFVHNILKTGRVVYER